MEPTPSPSDSPPRGYSRAIFSNPIDESLLCPLCTDVLRSAVTTPCCQHSFCRNCITSHLQQNSETCKCGHALRSDQLVDNQIADGFVSRLMIRCSRCKEWEGTLGALDHHIKTTCPETEMPCPACGTPLLGRDIEAHMANQCSEAHVPCPFTSCDMQVKRKDIEAHIDASVGRHLLGLQNQIAENRQCIDALQKTMEEQMTAAHRQHAQTAAQIQGLQDVMLKVQECMMRQLASKRMRHLYAWGGNARSRLGDGTTTNRRSPIELNIATFAIIPWAHFSAGGAHSLTLTVEGEVYAWGCNSHGQIGDGTTTDRAFPVKVTGPLASARVVQVAAGIEHSVALTDEGEVYAWGKNDYAQLGDGTKNPKSTPVRVCGAVARERIQRIATSYQHSLAVTTTGELYAWGRNDFGQLGTGENTFHSLPVPVGGPLGTARVGRVAAGGGHSLALAENGELYSWGGYMNGFLPVQVPLQGVVRISASQSHTLALTADGELFAWGLNRDGNLGDGSVDERNLPVRVGGALARDPVARIAAGDFFSLATTRSGKVYAWGMNNVGQLGDGTFTNRTLPVRVCGLEKNPNYHISAGVTHCLAWDRGEL